MHTTLTPKVTFGAVECSQAAPSLLTFKKSEVQTQKNTLKEEEQEEEGDGEEGDGEDVELLQIKDDDEDECERRGLKLLTPVVY